MRLLKEDPRTPFGTDHVTTELIRQLERRTAEALCDADAEALERLWADEYSMVTPAGMLGRKDALLAGLRTREVCFLRLDIESLAIRDYDATAIVLGRVRVETCFGGRAARGVARYQTVYLWRDAHWRAVSTLATHTCVP